MLKILNAMQRLVADVLKLFCFFCSTVGFQSLECADIKSGSAFNLQHTKSQQFIGCDSLQTALLPADPRTQSIALAALSEKDFRSRWYVSATLPSPVAPKEMFGSDIASGTAVNLRHIDSDFSLNLGAAMLTRYFGPTAFLKGIAAVADLNNIFLKKINDNTFVLTDNIQTIIGFNGTKLQSFLNKAAVTTPANFPDFHFTLVDIDENYSAQIINNLKNINATLTSKGMQFVETTLPTLTGTFGAFNTGELRKIAITLNSKTQPVVFGIRASDNGIYRINDSLNGGNLFNVKTYGWRNPAYPHPYFADEISFDSEGNAVGLLNRLTLQKTNWITNGDWANSTTYATKILVNGQYTLKINSDLASRMTLSSGQDYQEIATPFKVIDAAVGSDGTAWCVSDNGSVYKIDPGTQSYDKSDATKRDLLLRTNDKPAYIAVRAAGSKDTNIVAVLNSLGEVFVAVNNGEFKSLDFKGIVDIAIAENGTLALLSATNHLRYAGLPWVGNYFNMFDPETGKIAAAQADAKSVGAYKDYLDIPILVSQNGKYLSISEDGELASTATKANPDNSILFESRGLNIYSILCNDQRLAINKDYSLSMVDELGENQTDLFFVYGGTKGATETRIRHKDLFLTFSSDGKVSLVATEVKCKFESASELQIASIGLAKIQLAKEKARLEAESAAATKAVALEIQATQDRLIAAKLDSEKQALKAQIETLETKMTQLQAQQAEAIRTKIEMQAKLAAIEAEKVAQQKMLDEKIAGLTDQLNQESDPVKKIEIQKQIEALKGSKDSLADVLMQNVKIMAEQSKQEAELMAKKTALENDIANIERNAQENAALAKQALSGDITTMITSIFTSTQNKLAAALGIDLPTLSAKFPNLVFAATDLAALALLIGKSTDEIKKTATPLYSSAPADIFIAIKSDFEKLEQLKTLEPKQIVAGFKEDLGRFAPTIGMQMPALIEALSKGFASITSEEKAKQLQILLASKTTPTDQAAIKTRIESLRAGNIAAITIDANSPVTAEIEAKEKAIEKDFDTKIITAFTKTPEMLGSAWLMSKELVVRIINYDLLEEQYKKELERISATRDAKRAELLAALDSGQTDNELTAKLETTVDEKLRAKDPKVADQVKSLRATLKNVRVALAASKDAATTEKLQTQIFDLKSQISPLDSDVKFDVLRDITLFDPAKFANQQLRWMLRQYMDNRDEQQAVIDKSLTSLRKQMATAATSQDMESIIAKVKAFKSNNDEIMGQLRENDVKIMANERVMTKQTADISVLDKKIETIKQSQTIFMQQAVADKLDFEAQISKKLETYASEDDNYAKELAKIDTMTTATAEGIASQQAARSELQNKFFADKKAAVAVLQDLTSKYLTSFEKIKSSCTENIAELEGQQRILTQEYDKQTAEASLSNAVLDPAITATYRKNMSALDEEITTVRRIIDGKNFEIDKVQKDNADRLKILSEQIRDASAKQIEQMRYYMLSQGDEAKAASQERIKAIEVANKKLIEDVNANYELSKTNLQKNADEVKAANDKHIAELNASLAGNQERFAKRQQELEAGAKLSADQKKIFLIWRDKINAALEAKANEISLTSASYKESLNQTPTNFDALIDDLLNFEVRQSLPEVPKLLNLIGLQSSMSVREELVRETVVADLKNQIDISDLNIGKMFALGFTTGTGKETFGYMERDADQIIVRNTISILSNLKMKIVRKSVDLIAIEHPEKAMRMTLQAGGAINFAELKDNADKDGNVTTDASQIFKIEYGQQPGTFTLSNNGQYITISGAITASSTDKSAKFAMGSKAQASKFIAFKSPEANFEDDFKILTEGLPVKFKEFKASMSKEEFKAKITAFKAALAEGFNRIDEVRVDFVEKLNALFGEDDINLLNKNNLAETARIDSEVVFAKDKDGKPIKNADGSNAFALRDSQTQDLLQVLLTNNTELNTDTKASVQTLLNEACYQTKTLADITKEQNYRFMSLRQAYLKTTVEKNHQIGFLEVDSRWQKFQWARDIYLLIQLQLDASERDQANYTAELQSANDKFAAQKTIYENERSRAIEVLKASLAEKIAAAQKAREEIQKLSDEKNRIFNEHMAKMKEDLNKLQGEERKKREDSIKLLQETHDSQTKDMSDKFNHQLEIIRLDQERAEVMANLKTSVLQSKILNAQQYILSFKIDTGAEVTMSYKMPSTGDVWYVTRSTLDDLEVAKNIRFDQNTRFKLIKQDDESFSIETPDGKRRITLIDLKEVDLLAAKDVESKIPDLKGKMVADATQKFFIEGTQNDGVTFRDVNKVGYITVKEISADKNKKINILTFTTSKDALKNAADINNKDKNQLGVGETLFDVNNFTKGSNTINEMLNNFYASQDRTQSDKAVAAANEFFNKNKIYNYPHLMDSFVLALTEFGQGRVATGLMTESALADINKFIYEISQTFMFATTEGNQLVTSGGSIKLLDNDYVEPIDLEDGQLIVISRDGKRLSQLQKDSGSGNPEIPFVDGNIFDKAVNLKVVGSEKKNTVALLDYSGKKRLCFKDNFMQWTDAAQPVGAGDLFTFSGTRVKTTIITQNRGLTLFANAAGEGFLRATENFDEATSFGVSVVQANTIESMLINQGLDKYSDDAASKKVIDAIVAKMLELLESKQFDDDDKNGFLSILAIYLDKYVSVESISAWGNAIKKINFAAKQAMKKIDAAVMGKLSSLVQEFSVPTGAFLVLKNMQENKYLAVDGNNVNGQILDPTPSKNKNKLFKVEKVGDQYALRAQDGTGGYLTVNANGIVTTEAAAGKPKAEQLFWLIGFGNQLSLKLASTTMQAPEGFLVLNKDLKLVSFDLDSAEQTKYTAGNARTKFEVQVLDENSLLRGIINNGNTAATRVFLESLMATRENTALTDDQQSLVAQQQFKDFEEIVLNKEILPAAKAGQDPIINYNLKPEFEELRAIKTDEDKGLYSLKDTLQYIEEYVFYDPVAKAGIKMGKIGERIFAAMKEAFSQFRLLEKNFDNKTINAIINPGNLSVETDAAGMPTKDYIGEYLDSLMGNETDPLKTSPILYRYVLNLATTLYSPKYTDNFERFANQSVLPRMNEMGQFLDKNNNVYTLAETGRFVSKTGAMFEEFADAINDPKTGKELAPEEDFAPGIKLVVSGTGNERKIHLEFASKNSKIALGSESQMSKDIKEKIVNALDRFIDGNSKILGSISNARDMLSRIEADTVVPPLMELKETLEKQFKANPTFKEEALQAMIRKVKHKAETETAEWRRQILVCLMEFVGTKASFEPNSDGNLELKTQESASKVIYNKTDILAAIDRIKRLLMEVKLLEGQIAISDKYEAVIDQAIELNFKAKYKEAAALLNKFVDDNKPKDWRKDDSPKNWFTKISPLPGDGSPATEETNMFDRARAWIEEKPVYSLRLLTEEQNRMRMNLLDLINSALTTQAAYAALTKK